MGGKVTAFGGLLLLLFPVVAAQEKKDELKLTEEEQALVDLTNGERKKADPGPVVPNAKLTAAAKAHAANMAKQDKLDHVLDEKKPQDRVLDAGYKYTTTAENIAWNQKTPKDVVAVWMNSEIHKKNILGEDFTEIGVAIVTNAKGEPYWVQVFGTPLKE